MECDLRILLVCQYYHPFVGGVEVHARQIAQEFAQSHHVEVAAINFAAYPPGRLAVLGNSLLAPAASGYLDGRVPVHSLAPSVFDRVRMLPIAACAIPPVRRYAYEAARRFGYHFFRGVYCAHLRRVMRRMRANVVHSMAGGYLGWTARLAARDLNVPFVCTPFVHPRQWGDGPGDIAFYQSADAVVGLVPTDVGYLAQIGVPQEKLHTIGVSPELPPAVDPAGFRARHGLQSANMVLYVGRMMHQKGAAALLAAAAEVWSKCPETRFVFIGPASPSELAKFNGVDPRIMYLGKVPLQEKADALAACDVFCMPSMSEILPTVYLEAWSYGKPVVGGLAHGLKELVEGNGAGLCVAQQGGEIANAIVTLLTMPSLRAELGARGRELVADRYSVTAVTTALGDLYSRLAHDRSAEQAGPVGGWPQSPHSLATSPKS